MRVLIQLLALRLAGALSRLALWLDRGPSQLGLDRSIEAAAARAVADAPLTGGARSAGPPVAADDSGAGGGEPELAGYRRLYARSQLPAAMGSALLLVDETEARFVPVFVGPGEALALQHRLAGEAYSRPLPHDLFDRLLDEVGGQLRHVRLEALRGRVFIATVVIELTPDRVLELDARASDAIILALGGGAAIFASDGLLAAAGRPLGPGER